MKWRDRTYDWKRRFAVIPAMNAHTRSEALRLVDEIEDEASTRHECARQVDLQLKTVLLGCNKLRAILSASDNGWRTMESAPMNGTSILVCGGTMCRTSDMDGLEWPTQGVHIAFRQGGIEPFWNAGDASAHDEYYVIKPTYWQPLPLPPNGETK